jgi:hypothetical protein
MGTAGGDSTVPLRAVITLGHSYLKQTPVAKDRVTSEKVYNKQVSKHESFIYGWETPWEQGVLKEA